MNGFSSEMPLDTRPDKLLVVARHLALDSPEYGINMYELSQTLVARPYQAHTLHNNNGQVNKD